MIFWFIYVNNRELCKRNNRVTASVKSAVRVLRILELFSNVNKDLTLKDVTRSLSIPKSSAYMLLATLVSEQYLEEPVSGVYKLSCFASLKQSWVDGWPGVIRRAAAPEMDRLLKQFGHSVVLGRLTSSYDVQIIDARQSAAEMSYRVGDKPIIPSWCSCMGHSMLSQLPEIEVETYLNNTVKRKFTTKTETSTNKIMAKLSQWKLCGYAMNVDERIDGASGLAVPILDQSGKPLAAINIVMLTPQLWHQKNQIIQAIKSASARIEQSIFLPQPENNPEAKSWLIG